MEKEYYDENEEFDLFDIIDIVKKYLKEIMIILLVGIIMISIGVYGVKFLKNEKITSKNFILDYTIVDKKYELIESEYYKIDPSVILEEEEYVNKFFEIKEIQDGFSKNKNSNNINNNEVKKNFIKNIISISSIKDTKNLNTKENFVLNITLDKKINISNEIINKYFEILEIEIAENLKKILENKNNELIKKNEESELKIKKINEEILEKIFEEGKIYGIMSPNLQYIVEIKYPKLITSKKIEENLYEENRKKMISLEEISHVDILKKEGKVVTKDKLSGLEKKVFISGIGITFILIVAYIMIREFLNKYFEEKKMEE